MSSNIGRHAKLPKAKEIDFVLDSFVKRRRPDIPKSIDPKQVKSTYSFTYGDIVWRNVIAFIYLHVTGFYGLYLLFTGQVFLKTFIFGYFYGLAGSIGVTVGAHRLWSHNAYKAKWQLKVILIYLDCIAFQNSIYEWVRDHRVHHKFTDTDADPHNYSRGFFFAHMGWLLVRKHPDVKRKGAAIDMSDLERDPLIMFQKKYYLILMPLIAFILPTIFNHWLTGQSLLMCWNTVGVLKYFLSLHYAWLVNSAAHSWGHKPFDKNIKPTDNRILAFITIGEGWHNYHHTFPWDYKAAEVGSYSTNLSAAVIDFFAKIGWAYDLKYVSDEMVCKRALRTGDGSFGLKKFKGVDTLTVTENDIKVDHSNTIWGWKDPDMSENAKRLASVINPTSDI